MKGAYLEVWSDLLGSAGVIAGALVIRYTGWSWVDSAVAVAIGIWVLPRTWTLLTASVNILLEGVPEEIDIDNLSGVLAAVPGVVSFHDLHVWAITSGKVSLTVHLVHRDEVSPSKIQELVRETVFEKFGIAHITVQCELTPCHQIDERFHFTDELSNGAHAEHGH
jgi:cobalt-zinc-cadmium efflux system protein